MAKGQKILVVEDDRKISALLKDYLIKSGFEVSVLYGGSHVAGDIKLDPPDLIILDMILPDKDGIIICKEIRAFSQIPIIFISARTEEIFRVLCLELGADDYICKPFSPKEVVSRVKAVLRRTKPAPLIKDKERLIVGPIIIDQVCHKVFAGKDNLQLTPTEFELLKAMVAEPDKVFTRNYLISKVRPYYLDEDTVRDFRNIDSHIKNLRIKIDKALPAINLIQTVHGIGYSLNLSSNDKISYKNE